MTEPRRWSFRTGDWIGVLGERTVVAVPPSQQARAAALWELLDGGAGFDETLDAVVAGGLRDLPGFVLVGIEDDRTRVVVRGEARVELETGDDVVHVAGDGASIWVERTVRGVTRTRIEVGSQPGPDLAPDLLDLLVAGGVVRLAVAETPPLPAPPTPSPSPEPMPEPLPEPLPEAGLLDGPATEAMPAVPPAVPAPAGVREHDGATRTGGVHPAPPAAVSHPVARLVFSSGTDVLVDRTVLVGRSPDGGRWSGTDEPRLVAVPSPHHEISSTHLEVRPGSGADHGTAVVTDLGSTNGTLIIQPGLPPEDLQPGVAVQLIPGAVVDLGDGVTFQVVDP